MSEDERHDSWTPEFSGECTDSMTAGRPEGTAVIVGPPEPGVYRRLLKNRSFRRLWYSQSISGIGDWIIIGLLMPLVTQLSGGSSFAVAGILIAKIIPSMFLSSVVGVFVDRFDRRRLMIFMDGARAVLVIGLAFTDSLLLIYAVVLVTEIASLFFVPAKNALIPMLVDEEDVATANGLSYTTQQAAMFVGLTGAGAMLAVFQRVVTWLVASDLPVVADVFEFLAPELLGPRAGVFMDSLTFTVSALIIITIKVKGPARREGRFDLKLIGRDIVESFTFLRAHTELRGFMTTIGMAILGGGAIVPLSAIHVQQNLTGTIPFLELVPVLDRLATAAPQTFMLVFMAAGMFIGAILVPRLSHQLPLQMLFVGGVGGFGVAMFGFASVEQYAVAALFALFAGAFIAAVSVAGNTYITETVDDSLRGRVFTSMESVVRVALLLSMVVVAPLGDLMSTVVERVVEAQGTLPADVVLTGSRLTMQFAALIVMGAAFYAFRRLEWRRTKNGAESGEKNAC